MLCKGEEQNLEPPGDMGGGGEGPREGERARGRQVMVRCWTLCDVTVRVPFPGSVFNTSAKI